MNLEHPTNNLNFFLKNSGVEFQTYTAKAWSVYHKVTSILYIYKCAFIKHRMTARKTVLKNSPPVEKNVSSFWNDISFTVFILCYKKYPRPHTKKDITRCKIGICLQITIQKCIFLVFLLFIILHKKSQK